MNERRERRTLDPRLDVVFNLLFGAEQNRRLLTAFLNDVLEPPAPIAAVQVLPAGSEAGPSTTSSSISI